MVGKYEVEELIHKAYESLKRGDADTALEQLKNALKINFEHPEVLYALKCLNWWLEKIKRLDHFFDQYEKGCFILSQWKSYYEFLERINEAGQINMENQFPNEGTADSCQYAIRRFVFSLALRFFLDILDSGNQQDTELLLQAGRCSKGSGEWVEAQKYLEQASRLRRDDSAILSELADVNALLGDERTAKVLFREAFFIDPQGIDIWALESQLIAALIEKVRAFGYRNQLLAEWIPVWGCIWGVFSIKRELKPVELGRLKQNILYLENEYRSSNKDNKNSSDSQIKPRLLNRYFWLVEHCEYNRDNTGLIDETLLKIKFIDPAIYEQYRGLGEK